MKFNVTGRIWIESPHGTYIGSGRITLLEKIEEFGSISKAARAMKMSYRQAWEQLDAMNKQSRKPLVIKASGGNGGGGTRITDEGLRVISMYKNLMKNFENFRTKEAEKLV